MLEVVLDADDPLGAVPVLLLFCGSAAVYFEV